MHHVFPDCKHFVDMPMKHDSGTLILSYLFFSTREGLAHSETKKGHANRDNPRDRWVKVFSLDRIPRDSSSSLFLL